MSDRVEGLLGPPEAARKLHLTPSGLRKYASDVERAAEELRAQVPGNQLEFNGLPVKQDSGRRLYPQSSIELIRKIKDEVLQGANRLAAARRVLGVETINNPDFTAALRELVREEGKLELRELKIGRASCRDRGKESV